MQSGRARTGVAQVLRCAQGLRQDHFDGHPRQGLHPRLPPMGLPVGQVRQHMNPRISLVEILERYTPGVGTLGLLAEHQRLAVGVDVGLIRAQQPIVVALGPIASVVPGNGVLDIVVPGTEPVAGSRHPRTARSVPIFNASSTIRSVRARALRPSVTGQPSERRTDAEP